MELTNEQWIEKLKDIASYVLQGLKEDEACIVCDVDPADYKNLIETNPTAKRFMEKSKINFKLAHLKAVQSKKNAGSSQWMLEKLLPKEFGSRGKEDNTPINIIGQIIQSIQNGENNSKLAPTTRGELLIEESEVRDIESALN